MTSAVPFGHAKKLNSPSATPSPNATAFSTSTDVQSGTKKISTASFTSTQSAACSAPSNVDTSGSWPPCKKYAGDETYSSNRSMTESLGQAPSAA